MTAPAQPELLCTALQRWDYRDALRRQLELRDLVIAEDAGRNYLMLVEHPPTITIGRSGTDGEVLADPDALERRGVTVVETNRGGKVTYHGPGQLVVYPIVDLRRRGPDLRRYLLDLQKWLVGVCRSCGVPAHADGPHTGVWVAHRKIASVGIAVRRWVTYHGVALNVCVDLREFDMIVPCGLAEPDMTSLERELGAAPPMAEVADRAARQFAEHFGMALRFAQLEHVRPG